MKGADATVPGPGAGAGGGELDKRSETIRDMFGRVAPRYDLLNHVLSGALDIRWRRLAARSLELDARAGARVLDLCCGTGDQALAVRSRGGRVAAADFCLPMLAIARRKFRRHSARSPKALASDALSLPFATATFQAATVSFGLRNVADLDHALAEIRRVLAPAARVAFLEFAVPESKLIQGPYLMYFRRILPRIGGSISQDATAYDYLPSSVLEFPQRAAFARHMEGAGFERCLHRNLAGGIVCLYTGVTS